MIEAIATALMSYLPSWLVVCILIFCYGCLFALNIYCLRTMLREVLAARDSTKVMKALAIRQNSWMTVNEYIVFLTETLGSEKKALHIAKESLDTNFFERRIYFEDFIVAIEGMDDLPEMLQNAIFQNILFNEWITAEQLEPFEKDGYVEIEFGPLLTKFLEVLREGNSAFYQSKLEVDNIWSRQHVFPAISALVDEKELETIRNHCQLRMRKDGGNPKPGSRWLKGLRPQAA